MVKYVFLILRKRTELAETYFLCHSRMCQRRGELCDLRYYNYTAIQALSPPAVEISSDNMFPINTCPAKFSFPFTSRHLTITIVNSGVSH